MRVRNHVASFVEACSTIKEIPATIEALFDWAKEEYCEDMFGEFPYTKEDIKIKYYCYDERIDWNTYIVSIDGYGVLGFTDSDVTK